MNSTGSYGWAQPLVAELADLDHANVAFCFKADACTRHFVASILRGWEARGADRGELQTVARGIHCEKRGALVARWWGFDPGRGLMRLIARLQGRTLARKGYDALAVVLADPARREMLKGARVIAARQLELVASGDASLVKAWGLETVAAFGPTLLIYIIEGLNRREPGITPRKVLDALRLPYRDDIPVAAGLMADTFRSARAGEALLGLLDRTPFPDPPWAGTPMIRPIRDAKTMQAVALQFGNCLGTEDMLWQALRGDAVFYVCDTGPFVVRLLRDRLAGWWFIDEVKGPRNKNPSARVASATLAAFADARFPRLPANSVPWCSGHVGF